MTSTQQLRELLNELKLARGKNCLIFAIYEQPARLKELIASAGFEVREIYLKGKKNLLEMLLRWNARPENSVYLVHGIGNQFPWVLPYINLHRDLFFDIKRPVVVVGSEYEIKEIQKHAPDWFRFRSRTYKLKDEGKELGEGGEERLIMPLAEPVYYPLFIEEESEEEIKERIKIDEYLLSSERDDYKRAELYMSLSLSYFKLSDFERGEEYLQRSNDIRAKLKDKRGIVLNYERLSSIFILKRDFKKVIDTCNEALKIDPDLDVFYYYRGLAYGELNQHERAIEDFGKAIALNPDFAEAYNNRGVAYARLNQHESAIEDYDKAIALNPDLAVAYNNRGVAYAGLKQYESAIEDYGKAIQLNPDFAEAYNNRGLAYAGLKQYESAIEDYGKAIQLNPDLAEAYNNRGNAYAELNQYERAIEDYDTAIELNPDFAKAYYNRGLAYARLNQYDSAIEDFGKAIQLNPDFAEAYGNRGFAYSKIGRYEESAQDLKKAGILFLSSEKVDDSVGAFSLCFGLRDNIESIESEDVIYCGLALFLVTKDAKIRDELRGMRIQDEIMRELFELAMRKLRNEDISEEIATIEAEEKRKEMQILLELLKRF